MKGSLNLFNHRTNVNVNNRIVCYDIKELGKQMKKLGMLIVQDQVWGRVTANRSSGKSTRYYMDEMHLLLKEEQTAAYSGLTEQQEALLFAQQTGVSAPLTAGAKMRAKIRGGDPEAIAFLNATNRAGFGLSFAQSHAKWKIACIATAFAEYRKHGERIYTDALRVLAEAWEGDIDSLRAEVLQGVTQFVALYDHEYDPIRLIRQLQRTSPVAIYRSGQAMTGPNYQKYMLQILKAYNGSSRTKSLPIKK